MEREERPSKLEGEDPTSFVEGLGQFCLQLSEVYVGRKPEDGPVKYHHIRGYKE